VDDAQEMIREEPVVAYVRYLTGIFLGGKKKTTT
jgi:hypothetical protein